MHARTIFGTALTVLVLLAGAGLATAGKPSKPPPPPPVPVDGGTIYFASDGLMHSVLPDGSGHAVLHANVQAGAEPSLHLHGGARWFLQAELLDGVGQLYAVSQTGDRVCLLADPTLYVGGSGGSYVYGRWADDDRLVGFCAWRRYADGTFEPDETGQYVLEIDWDADTGTPFALQDPVYVPLPSHINPLYGDSARNLCSDWSPDGSSVVYVSWSTYAGCWRADAPYWEEATRLTSDMVAAPRWSPNGQQLTLTRLVAIPNGMLIPAGIDVMDADGSDRTTVIPDPSDSTKTHRYACGSCWSPAGTHLAYTLWTEQARSGSDSYQVYVSGADGSSPTLLTTGSACAWRGQ